MNAYESQRESLLRRIYNINEKDFDAVALDLFQFQYQHNTLYRTYCESLRAGRVFPATPASIPCIPISFFKEHEVRTGSWVPQQLFRSSGTTQAATSQHLIRDIEWYHGIAKRCFEKFFNQPAGYSWIGLLPTYLERTDSSLVEMVRYFMQSSTGMHNHFYLHWDNAFFETIQQLAAKREPTLMIGVSFAILDLFEQHDIPVWESLTVIETGGMKGRRAEITREELRSRILKRAPGLALSSEYGMTELLSQAYWRNGKFYPGDTMRVIIRDISDPFSQVPFHQRGAINIIDLANIDSCAFIATDDIGISYPDHSFDVLGRLDQSDVRGCNLMYA